MRFFVFFSPLRCIECQLQFLRMKGGLHSLQIITSEWIDSSPALFGNHFSTEMLQFPYLCLEKSSARNAYPRVSRDLRQSDHASMAQNFGSSTV